jgi:hypothetical protein
VQHLHRAVTGGQPLHMPVMARPDDHEIRTLGLGDTPQRMRRRDVDDDLIQRVGSELVAHPAQRAFQGRALASVGLDRERELVLHAHEQQPGPARGRDDLRE